MRERKGVAEAQDQLIMQILDYMESLWGGAGHTGILDGLSSTGLSDLTMSQVCTLMFLRPGPQRIGRIAERLGTSLPSTTSIINRLEQRNFVERVRDEVDRRGILCRLTDAGEERIDILYEHERTMMANRMRDLGLGELGTIAHAFALIAEVVLSTGNKEGD